MHPHPYRYGLIRPLGAGSFGEVHLALDTHTNTYVAIKILKDPTGLQRFVREAKILIEEVGNHHVVQILDTYFTGPAPFLVLEYCDQGSLEEWIKNHRSWQEVAVVLSHVVAGLMPLHARGGFHRDLKPGNLLLTKTPNGLVVKVADFGLARRPQTGPAGMTRTACGTDGYIAPEVLRSAPFDWRADVYSLGVVALELLTGNRRVENLDAIEIPADLRLLVRRMLSSDPASRPSARECFDELTRVVDAPVPTPAADESVGPTFGQALFGGLIAGAALLGLAALFADDSEEENKGAKRRRTAESPRR